MGSPSIGKHDHVDRDAGAAAAAAACSNSFKPFVARDRALARLAFWPRASAGRRPAGSGCRAGARSSTHRRSSPAYRLVPLRGHGLTQRRHRAIQLLTVSGIQPRAVRCSGITGTGLVVERVRSGTGSSRGSWVGQPIDGRPAACRHFLRAHLLGVGQVAAADDVDDARAQHAGRGVDQDGDALAADLQTGEVLPVPVSGELSAAGRRASSRWAPRRTAGGPRSPASSSRSAAC